MNARKSVLGAAVVMGALVAFAGLAAGMALAGTGQYGALFGPGGRRGRATPAQSMMTLPNPWLSLGEFWGDRVGGRPCPE